MRVQNQDILTERAQNDRSDDPESSTFQFHDDENDENDELSGSTDRSQTLYPSIPNWEDESSPRREGHWNPLQNQWDLHSQRSLIPRRSKSRSISRSNEQPFWNHGQSERSIQGTLAETSPIINRSFQSSSRIQSDSQLRELEYFKKLTILIFIPEILLRKIFKSVLVTVIDNTHVGDILIRLTN